MKKLGLALGITLSLAACSSPGDAPGTSAAGEGLSGISLADAQMGEVLVESVEGGSNIDLTEYGLRKVVFQANTLETTFSKVELTFDGETFTDTRAPYDSAVIDTADYRLGKEPHTVTVTPYDEAGRAQRPLEVSFSVKALDYNRFLYVFRPSAIDVFDIDKNHEKVKSIPLPAGIHRVSGAVAHGPSGMLYISYQEGEGKSSKGGLLAYNLVTEKLVWKEFYGRSADSPAMTEDGKTLYLSSTAETDAGSSSLVIDAADGSVTDSLEVQPGTHNTIVGLSGRYAYLASSHSPYLVMADTSTNEIVKKIGPFRDGVRPFTINGEETLAFVNVNRFLGFEVGDIATGKVLHSVQVEGFKKGPFQSSLAAQSHGVALSPDEKEVWVLDSKNRRVHLYDVTGLPEKTPIYITSVELPSTPNWVQFSRDGRFAYTSGGEVIDTVKRTIIATTPSAKVRLQIDTLKDKPIRAFVRYGLGYETDLN